MPGEKSAKVVMTIVAVVVIAGMLAALVVAPG
jgi:hypothetical protein